MCNTQTTGFHALPVLHQHPKPRLWKVAQNQLHAGCRSSDGNQVYAHSQGMYMDTDLANGSGPELAAPARFW